MIRYYKLFDLLTRRGMKKSDLLEVISAPTIAKLSKGETIKTDTIDKICLFLECQPSDIMEVLDEIDMADDGHKYYIKSSVGPDMDIPDPDDDRKSTFIDDYTELISILEDPEKWERYRTMILEEYKDKMKKTES